MYGNGDWDTDDHSFLSYQIPMMLQKIGTRKKRFTRVTMVTSILQQITQRFGKRLKVSNISSIALTSAEVTCGTSNIKSTVS